MLQIRSSPYLYLFLSQLSKEISILWGMCICGFQSRCPLVAALSFRIWGALSLPPCSSPGIHVPCYTGSWWSLGRHTSQDGGLYVLQRSRSQHSLFTVQHPKHLTWICAWLGRFPQFPAPSTFLDPCTTASAFSFHPFLRLHGCLPTLSALMAEFSEKHK